MTSAPWLGPFTRHPGSIVRPASHLEFRCPVSGADVAWAAKDVFNPAAVVHGGRVHLLVRGEDTVGPFAGTSRIGLAVSDDGVDFTVEPEPVLFPDDDEQLPLEWPGGCEDARVVASPEGGFVCLYTGFDGTRPRLLVATSDDLRTWRKHGSAFAGTAHEGRASKSGAVVTELVDGRLVAARIRDRFWMYWGEGACFAATSDDLVRWVPVEHDSNADRWLAYDPDKDELGRWAVHAVPGPQVLRPLLVPRPRRFDSLLVEPGPPAVLTDDGIVLIYNGANHWQDGHPDLPAGSYQPGQAVFDPEEPGSCTARTAEPFLRADDADARSGQVDNVLFAEGLVHFRDRWLLYLGLADSRIGLATAPA